MGYIYIIKNTVNNKVYIGQTRRTIQLRFNEHLNLSKKPNIKTKLYLNIRELGIESFM